MMPARRDFKECTVCRKTKARDEFPLRIYKNRGTTTREFCNDCKVRGNLRKNLWTMHHITLEQYEALEQLQHGCCAACGQVPNGKRRMAVDHDHGCCDGPKSCGRCVRGLLCDPCNVALGMVNDSKERLMALIRYLDEYCDGDNVPQRVLDIERFLAAASGGAQ